MTRNAPGAPSEIEQIQAIERERIRALVKGEIEEARQLYADEYELVTPRGAALSKEEYLGAVAARDLHYICWEMEPPIKVRVYGDVALIRYQAVIEIVERGRAVPRGRFWHTDVYEKRLGSWRIVWSQATAIA